MDYISRSSTVASGLSSLNEDQIAGAAPGRQGATTENTGSI
jgi:hypothetical protein